MSNYTSIETCSISNSASIIPLYYLLLQLVWKSSRRYLSRQVCTKCGNSSNLNIQRTNTRGIFIGQYTLYQSQNDLFRNKVDIHRLSTYVSCYYLIVFSYELECDLIGELRVQWSNTRVYIICFATYGVAVLADNDIHCTKLQYHCLSKTFTRSMFPKQLLVSRRSNMFRAFSKGNSLYALCHSTQLSMCVVCVNIINNDCLLHNHTTVYIWVKLT